MYKVKLEEKRDVADSTRLFSFSKPENFEFTEGQYIEMNLFNVDDPETRRDTHHFFSIASSDCDNTLDFLTRVRDSKFKQALDSLQVGDEIGLTDPKGNFLLPENEEKVADREVLLLVGGVGISVVRAFLRGIECHELEFLKKSLVLFNSNKTVEAAPILSELAQFEWLKQHLFFTEELDRDSLQEVYGPDLNNLGLWEKRIDSNSFKNLLDDFVSGFYFVVGPPGFVNAMKDLLSELGIDSESVYSDSFSGY